MVSKLLNSFKGVSSRLLRKERPDIQKRAWNVVAILLHFILWRYADLHRAPIHPIAANTTLKGETKDGYAVRAILPCYEGRGLSRTGSLDKYILKTFEEVPNNNDNGPVRVIPYSKRE